LSKKQAEVLDSTSIWWNLLYQNTEMCFFRGRQNEFKGFYPQEKVLVFCNYIYSEIETLWRQHEPPEWRCLLTLWRLMTCIYIYMSYRTANFQKLHFIYLVNKYTYWIF
jgi:hypothetical protein